MAGFDRREINELDGPFQMADNEGSSSSFLDKDIPVPLSELRPYLTSQTWQWLADHDETAARDQAEDDSSQQDSGGNSAWLFRESSHGQEEDHGNQEEAEEEEQWERVNQWCSSTTSVDGIGGYKDSQAPDPNSADDHHDENIVSVQYILSSSAGGHGDALWAAARHVANQLANADQCRVLLEPLWKRQGQEQPEQSAPAHPLKGLRFLELGAGAGVPSWTALWCGASLVVCTDQGIPDRIRCLAECAYRNEQSIRRRRYGQQPTKNTNEVGIADSTTVAKICPYDWGTPVDEIANLLTEQQSTSKEKHGKTQDQQSSTTAAVASVTNFDVIVAADCLYMPQFHDVLLQSIDVLLAPDGVALLPFALHGNTRDEAVWEIVARARNTNNCRTFDVEVLPAVQLTPQAYGMEDKRALVHTIRLTRHASLLV